ncbi:hypothetical protein HY948_01295 [Candidatus Gottesmanbacteria bacterium]|nr:hypothetical protein [Candidatus Gottesmanbacteria bacterium]
MRAGCPIEKECYKAESFGDDSRFSAVGRTAGAISALKESLQGIQLNANDYSSKANQGRSALFPAEVAVGADDLYTNAELIVCFGQPNAPDYMQLTSESQALLEAAVSPPGCYGDCPRYQAYQGQG